MTHTEFFAKYHIMNPEAGELIKMMNPGVYRTCAGGLFILNGKRVSGMVISARDDDDWKKDGDQYYMFETIPYYDYEHHIVDMDIIDCPYHSDEFEWIDDYDWDMFNEYVLSVFKEKDPEAYRILSDK